jgi:hypothetical protein
LHILVILIFANGDRLCEHDSSITVILHSTLVSTDCFKLDCFHHCYAFRIKLVSHVIGVHQLQCRQRQILIVYMNHGILLCFLGKFCNFVLLKWDHIWRNARTKPCNQSYSASKHGWHHNTRWSLFVPKCIVSNWTSYRVLLQGIQCIMTIFYI